jgi:hypothetical protein
VKGKKFCFVRTKINGNLLLTDNGVHLLLAACCLNSHPIHPVDAYGTMQGDDNGGGQVNGARQEPRGHWQAAIKR